MSSLAQSFFVLSQISVPRRRLAGLAALAMAAVAAPALAQVIEPASSVWQPRDVAVDAQNNLYITDIYGHRVLKVRGGVVTVIAGTGTAGYGGDGGPGTSAQLNVPTGIAVDSAGNVYVADQNNHRIRRVSAAGTISTYAGTGTAGFSGDGGAATSAQLGAPRGVAVDGSGNVYIADYNNHRVRRVSATGTISTFAGTGTPGRNIDTGTSTLVQLHDPTDVAVDRDGNVYIMDQNNNRVRRVSPAGELTTIHHYTFSPNDRLQAVAVDRDGNLYIADRTASVQNDSVIRRVGSGGGVSVFAGTLTMPGFSGDGGPATSAWLDSPYGVTVDSAGNVYIADTNNYRVRKVDGSGIISTFVGTTSGLLAGTVIETFAGGAAGTTTVAGFGGDGGPAASAELNNPLGVALDASGNLYIADTNNHRVRKVDAGTGNISTIAGTGTSGHSGDGGAATLAQVNTPSGVHVDGSGNVYIADTNNHRVRKVDAGTGNISTIAGTGTSGHSGDGGAATSSMLWWPADVATDGSGNVYIADLGNHRVRKVDGSGIISTFAGNGNQGAPANGVAATSTAVQFPRGVATDASGNVYVAIAGQRAVKVDAMTGILSIFAGSGNYPDQRPRYGGGPATSANINAPQGIAVDGSGNVYIASPQYVHKVYAASGIISAIAGAVGSGGYSGDGGAPTSAQLNSPSDVVAAPSGNNVYIADANNHRIRLVRWPTPPPTVDVPATPVPPPPPPPPPPPNVAPEVSSALADAMLAVGETLRVDLGAAFRDANGDLLAYSAMSSDAALASASTVGTDLVLVGLAAGVATVTVTATDPQGLRVAQTLTAVVGSTLWLSGEDADAPLLAGRAGSAAEGGTVMLRARLSAPRETPTAFAWQALADADPATADADAGEHGDASGTATIAAGETSAEIAIAIADDADVEPAREWFVVELQSEELPLGRARLSVAVLEGVCDRSAAAVQALAGERACSAPTDAELRGLRTLNLEGLGIEALEADDLQGLTGLQALLLRDNALAALPEGLLASVPGLRWLRLGGNRLSALAEDAFAGLAELQELELSNNALRTLPSGVLQGLTELRRLRLDGNALEALPEGLFADVDSLRSAWLGDNPGAPFDLRVELRRTDAASGAPGPATIRAELAAGAPFPIEVGLSVRGGELGAADGMPFVPGSASLAAGDTAGGAAQVSAPGDGAAWATATVGGVPETICDGWPCWNGMALSAGDALTLFKTPPMAGAAPTPLPLFGHGLRLPLESLIGAGDSPLVRWQASSSDPDVATATIRGGDLLVEPVPGAEGEVRIEVTTEDAVGLSATLRFTVRVDFHWPSRPGWRDALEMAQPIPEDE